MLNSAKVRVKASGKSLAPFSKVWSFSVAIFLQNREKKSEKASVKICKDSSVQKSKPAKAKVEPTFRRKIESASRREIRGILRQFRLSGRESSLKTRRKSSKI